ncbi:NAD(P)H-hydrate dehydratase [Paenibacillus sp. 32352]|uniref:NAD(P)H-hydrate dehydratase n=1 Tax=Paenibacillus sp. 32352 TaxID=1969111 RepID=UPI0009AC3306|nr:NAD(P)H-hydrate dehydratase [Paenibacillus sp. 32352]
MFVVTNQEMRTIDAYAIETIGIPSMVLMENAGRAVADEVTAYSGGKLRRWAILVGKGNNGGDGVVAARHLIEAGMDPTVIYIEDPAGWKGESAAQSAIAARFGVPSQIYQSGSIDWRDYDGIVDALLGTGSRGKPRESYAQLILEANASGLPIIAVDIPSGLDADTGEVHDPCIEAERTVALAFTKRGLEQYPGAGQAGEVVVRPIGIVSEWAALHGVRTYLTNEAMFKNRFGFRAGNVTRPQDSNKGTYGHVLVAAGSRQMSGAGHLCSRAALRGGCGLVTWALPESLQPAMMGTIPEIMLMGLKDSGLGDWSSIPASSVIELADKKRSIVIGPGMGRWEGDSQWLREIWGTSDCPLVLDADALNMLADADLDQWPSRRSPVILTPHPGEMARLTGLSIRDVQRDRIELARSYARRHGVILVLKGARTVIAEPDGAVTINTTGNPKMAVGGAGDVLAGLIASLIAQGFSAKLAAVYGVYLHGEAGDRAAAARAFSRSITAGDIIDEL